MIAALLKKSPEEEALYQRLQTDPALLAFHGKQSGGKRYTEEDAAGAIALLNAVFDEMSNALCDSDWLVANTYTLADISWGPTITTLIGGGFDFSPYPEVWRWYQRISQRPTFEIAVLEWRRAATYAAAVDRTVSAEPGI